MMQNKIQLKEQWPNFKNKKNHRGEIEKHL